MISGRPSPTPGPRREADASAGTMRDVRLSKSARYALYAAGSMAAAGDRPVTVGEIAALHGIPPPALAKVFQQLVRVGLAAGTRGVGGGYRLAKRAKDVTLLDVLHVYDPPAPSGSARAAAAGRPRSPVGPGSVTDRLHRLFDEVDEMVRCTFASVSLATLAGTNRRLAPRATTPAKPAATAPRTRVGGGSPSGPSKPPKA
jgi:Rrf2 family transcriptional regulator, iron-sulfur cluster assembly transcription factor